MKRGNKLDKNHSATISDFELAELAMNSLRYRSLRSWLAVLGIVIGVGAVIGMVTTGQGTTAQVTADMAKPRKDFSIVNRPGKRSVRIP